MSLHRSVTLTIAGVLTALALIVPVRAQVSLIPSSPVRRVTTLPATCGVGEAVIVTSGSVALNVCTAANTWTALGSGASVPGSDTQVLFNDGGALGADAGLTFDKTTDVLTVGTLVVSGSHLTGPDGPVLGTEIDITAGAAATGESGATIVLGGGGGGAGGGLQVTGGSGAVPGSLDLVAANGAGVDGGYVRLAAGTATGMGNGGRILLSYGEGAHRGGVFIGGASAITDAGLAREGVGALAVINGSNGYGSFTASNFLLSDATGSLGFTSDTTLTRAATGILTLDAASTNNALRLTNGANPEYGSIGWDGGNNFRVGSQGGVNGGTGRNTIVGSALGAAEGVLLATEATARWRVTSTGLLVPYVDNTYAIGDATHRVSNVYAALTNATGLPISTGVSGLGTGVATFLATPSSANLLAALTTKTGTGNAVFSISPTITGGLTIGAYTLPATDGSASQVLQTNGSGAVTWATVSSGAATAPLTGTGATVTTDTPLINVTQTWNAAATFTAIRLNVTDTSSNQDSFLMDLQRGGTSNFRVTGKSSSVANTAVWSAGRNIAIISDSTAISLMNNTYIGGPPGGSSNVSFISPAMSLASGWDVRWSSDTNSQSSGDTGLHRTSAGLLEINNVSGACSTAANCRDLKLRHLLASGTAPTVANTSANSCGTTAATIAGADGAGKVTVGATAGTSCTVTFGTAWPNAPACAVSNETTANLVRTTSTTTTVILAGTFAAGDVLAYQCLGY